MEPMAGRWVCRRCFASNDAEATTCEQCSLERGADPASAPAGEEGRPAGQWVSPQPAPGRSLGQMALSYWWVAVIPAVLIAGWWFSARRDDSGQIANSGNLQVQDLRAGDCFDLKDPEASEIDEVEAKPCTELHEFEMYHVVDMQSASYPTDAEFDAFIGQECLPAFSAYVGVAYRSSMLEVIPITPTSGSWDDGDHSVQCALYDPNNAQLTASMRDAAR